MPRNNSATPSPPPASPDDAVSRACIAVLGGSEPLLAAESTCFAIAGEGGDHGKLDGDLRQTLAELRDLAGRDPFSNPIQLLALDINRRVDRGNLTFGQIEQLIQRLTIEAYGFAASRLGKRLGECDPRANLARVRARIEAVADGNGPVDFRTFAKRVERAAFGVVFTAHPTFSVAAPLMRILAQLATDRDLRDAKLDDAARQALLRAAAAALHRPERDLDLATEHTQSMEAIGNAQAALRQIFGVVLAVARERYPEDWTRLTPQLMTVASWVGYDLDGRADITWSETLHRRIILQQHQLRHYRDAVTALLQAVGAAAEPLRHILALLESRFDSALRIAEADDAVFAQAAAGEASWLELLSRQARRMHADRDRRLLDSQPVIDLLTRAIECAGALADDAVLDGLVILRAELANNGFSMAHTHVRLNATQVHNAIRRQIGMDEAPDAPSHRRSYTASIGALLDEVKPVSINFGSVHAERATARRLFMIVAQIVKYIDASTPVRFLIAETETSFTLLAALYFAKLFDVADKTELSPLFETRRALERGPRVIEEALQNRHYRDYVRGHGRLCIQTGYSDTGRYLGQTVAAAGIERMRLRIGEILAQHDLGDCELLIFDTHGESIGRGAHPGGIDERLRYLAPAASRAQLARAGIAVKQETSFQGGDGYLCFFTPAAALATATRIVEFSFSDPEEDEDPFYRAADYEYVTEFFTTIQFFNERVMADPNYAALLGAFGINFLYPTGSRSLRRQHEGGVRVDLTSARQLRAIPHNAVLHQLGYLATTVGGAGRAIGRNPEAFRELFAASPRFRLLCYMILWALAHSDLDVLKAYIDCLDPELWLLWAIDEPERASFDERRRVAAYMETAGNHGRLKSIFQVFQTDTLELRRLIEELIASDASARSAVVEVPDAVRDNSQLLHALRLALMQRIYLLSTHIPDFSDRNEITLDEMHAQIVHLDITEVIAALDEIFPRTDDSASDAEFGETASYENESAQSYEVEHARIFQPAARLYELVRRISTGVTYSLGAVG